MTITYSKRGGRTIELFLPFEVDGKEVSEIAFGPLRLDHTIRWQKGEWRDHLGLMAELSGLPESALRALAYPDADRVQAVFFDMLSPEIRASMMQQQQLTSAEPMQSEAAPQGNGQDQPWAMPERDARGQYHMDAGTRQAGDNVEGLGIDLDG